ncbi:hypothetical protein WICMUC_005193 [Wickerhamomyces mucosus]|uniref:Bacterial surface antigen (D15) domain-containing protein n=1 Tax=Wickerhamomyces mucosus TaxID=1378264 RepID=A0A9P8P8N4_9ASCO|nr:hypothetical protein WICMUC_005193 [Wickerhamomyces mucosus]
MDKDEDSVVNQVQSSFKDEKNISRLQELELERNQILVNDNITYLENLFRLNSSKSVSVSNVLIEGTETFRDSFLAKQISPFINDSQNLGKLLQNVHKVNESFLKSGGIQDLSIQLEHNPINTYSNSIEVIPKIKLLPIKKFLAKTGTNVGNGEGDGYMTFQLKNIFGGCENLMFDATTGTRTRSSYLLNYSSPWFNNTSWKFDNSLFLTSRKIDWSNHEQVIKGINTKLISNYTNSINHEFSIENILRAITNVSLNSSTNVKFQAGDDFKTSLLYKFIYDTRDDKTLPSKGFNFNLTNEVSGLLANYNTSKFLKQSFETSIATNFNEKAQIINLSLRGGWLYSFNKVTHLMDRFYLGGPNDVRGFFYNGLGPRNFNDTLGGDLFLSGGLSIFQKFPYFDESTGLKFHYFLNFGNLIPLDHEESITKSLTELITRPSIGTGVGIVFKHPIARFELNFVLPVACHENDSIRKGLQYGIGLSFM